MYLCSVNYEFYLQMVGDLTTSQQLEVPDPPVELPTLDGPDTMAVSDENHSTVSVQTEGLPTCSTFTSTSQNVCNKID